MAGISPSFLSPSFIAIFLSTILILSTLTGLTSSVKTLSSTFPSKFLYELALNTGDVIKNGIIITIINNNAAIKKLFFAILDALSPLSNIISNIPTKTKNKINVVKPEVKSNLSTGSLIKAYIATIIKAIPYALNIFLIFSPLFYILLI